MIHTAALFEPQLALARVRRDQPALRDRPLMLWAQRGQTALVTAADDLRLVGLSLARAERLCPDADYLATNPQPIGAVWRLSVTGLTRWV